jgi:hypothetical protein
VQECVTPCTCAALKAANKDALGRMWLLAARLGGVAQDAHLRHSVFGCRLSSTPSIQYSLRLLSLRGDAAAWLLPALPAFGAKPRN